MSNWNTDTILIVMVAITGVSVLLQFVVLLAIFLTMRKGVKVATAKAEELQAAAIPVIQSSKELIQTSKELIQTSRELIVRLEPKLNAAATDLSEIARTARMQTAKIEVSVEEINQRVLRQAARVDGMTTSVLNGVDRVGQIVNEAVSVPVRQVSGILAAAKAVVETLRAPVPPRRPVRDARAPEDKDLFV